MAKRRKEDLKRIMEFGIGISNLGWRDVL